MKSLWFRYLPLVLLAVAWEAVSRLGLVSSSALPPLSEVVTSWIDLIKTGELRSSKHEGYRLIPAGALLEFARKLVATSGGQEVA